MLIGEIISMNAYRFPGKVALITEQGRLTYKELKENANRIANFLLSLGIKKGQRIALLDKTSMTCIETTTAITKTGAILVGINNLLNPKELLKVLIDCDPSILIFGAEYQEVVGNVKGDLDHIVYLCQGDCNWAQSVDSGARDASTEKPSVLIDEDEPFMILYTAGTTGEPKGAVYTHRAFWDNLLMTVIDTYKQGYDDIWLGPVPMYHIGGYGTLLRIFLMSNTFVLKSKFDASDYLATIEREQITILYAYPTMINAIVQAPGAEKHDLSSLKLVIYGGSPIPESTLEKAHRLFKCCFIQRYGATECCGSAILILSPDQHRRALSEKGSAKRILQSAGKPCMGVKLRLLDERDEEVTVAGKSGVLLAQLQAPMKEYWRAPEETGKVLKNGWLRLGDIAKFDEDGFFYLVDREKDMIVSGARNIYPREVEEVLYSHPAIQEACVIGVPDEYWGEAVKAVVVLRPGEVTSENEIISYCKRHLASYKKPKSVDFVISLPKNPGGKILKRELRKKYWEGKDRYIH